MDTKLRKGIMGGLIGLASIAGCSRSPETAEKGYQATTIVPAFNTPRQEAFLRELLQRAYLPGELHITKAVETKDGTIYEISVRDYASRLDVFGSGYTPDNGFRPVVSGLARSATDITFLVEDHGLPRYIRNGDAIGVQAKRTAQSFASLYGDPNGFEVRHDDTVEVQRYWHGDEERLEAYPQQGIMRALEQKIQEYRSRPQAERKP